MKVIVTGAAGYLGERVATLLLSEHSPLAVSELVLVDVAEPRAPRDDPRVRTRALDLAVPGAADRLLDASCDALFHLAAIVSGQAETEFEFGMRVNFDATRSLLEAARRHNHALRFVFTSTSAAFGGELPLVVDERTAVTPQTSYGCAKAMSELLVNEYSRRGFVDGRVVRLPTVSVRAGAPNRAITSFASGIIREPLNGLEATCPVPAEQELWLTSPATVVRNIVHAATLVGDTLGAWRVINLPGFRVSVREMMAALHATAGAAVAARVRFVPDVTAARMVASFPSRFDNTRALSLGFVADSNFVDVIRAYIRDDLKKTDASSRMPHN